MTRSACVGMAVLASVGGLAMAQPTAHFYLDTDAPGGMVAAGQTVHVRVMADWTGGVQFAGTRFRIDVEGDAGTASNFTSIFPPIFFRVGPVSGGSVRDIDLATFAPFHLGGFVVPPFNEPTLTLVEYDWVAPNLPHGTTIGVTMDNDGGRPGAFIFTTAGASQWTTADTTFEAYTFTIAPVPGGLAVVLVAGALCTKRRRRRG